MTLRKGYLAFATAGLLASAGAAQADELTANAAASNNYIWRGLTQSVNEAAVSGGIDYTMDNGFYIGTWASNVSYGAGDTFSYEHDMYGGYAGEIGEIGYDVGYLYYNYDDAANFDFGEIYGSLSFNSFTLGLNVLTNTEADEGIVNGVLQDFGFGKASYVYADYATDIRDGLALGFHIGYHAGDFNEAFNGVPDNYTDYNISLSKGGFSFMITDTNLDAVPGDELLNDEMKFVVGYSMDTEL
jgi:uncharacterized protein (TIGR02001 family)